MNWRAVAAAGLHQLPIPLHTLLPPEQRADLRHRLGRHHPWEDGGDLSPPTRHPGEAIGPPDFVGIGVKMAGVRRWYELVADHPGISVRADIPMARHYLSHFAARSFGADEISHYYGWFPRRPGTITGEWTPAYAALPWVAGMLARAAPDARLLLMVRNPIERFRLALAQKVGSRGTQVGARIADAIDRGYYGAQLRRVLEHFPAERVLVLQYERCVADSVAQLAATYRFLGLDETHRPSSIRPPTSIIPAPRSAIDPDAVHRLVGVYAGDVDDLVSMVPGFDLSLWPEFGGG